RATWSSSASSRSFALRGDEPDHDSHRVVDYGMPHWHFVLDVQSQRVAARYFRDRRADARAHRGDASAAFRRDVAFGLAASRDRVADQRFASALVREFDADAVVVDMTRRGDQPAG